MTWDIKEGDHILGLVLSPFAKDFTHTQTSAVITTDDDHTCLLALWDNSNHYCCCSSNSHQIPVLMQSSEVNGSWALLTTHLYLTEMITMMINRFTITIIITTQVQHDQSMTNTLYTGICEGDLIPLSSSMQRYTPKPLQDTLMYSSLNLHRRQEWSDMWNVVCILY